jgi:hypothetical protein
MNPSHVESVFIAGKPKKWRGALVGVDMERVRRSSRNRATLSSAAAASP